MASTRTDRLHLPDQQLQRQQLLGRCRFQHSSFAAAGRQQRQRLDTTENTALSIPASTLLANDTDPNSLPLSITGVSNPSNGTVTYNASTQTISFVPTSNYVGPASFTYTITDGQASASGNVSVTVNNPPTAQTLFGASATPGTITVNDPNGVSLGVKFEASANGTISGIRFYKGPENTGTHVADLWTSTGTLLASGTFSNETASGWQQVNFSSPVSITAGTEYVASYYTSSGDYSADANYFANAVTSGSLTALASGTSGGDGVYAYGSGPIFPTDSFDASNYWVDVVFNTAAVSRRWRTTSADLSQTRTPRCRSRLPRC